MEEEYYRYLATYNKSSHTITAYRIGIRQFCQWRFQKLPGSVSLEDWQQIKKQDIHGFMSYLKDSGLSDSSRNQKLAAVKSFFHWLAMEQEQLPTDPTLHVPSISVPHRAPKFYTVSQLEEILTNINGRNAKRNQAIIALAAVVGLRREELTALNMEDFQTDRLRVVGKGNKERWVMLSPGLIQILQEYLEFRANNNTKCKALFISQQGERMCPHTIYQMVGKIQKALHLPTGVHIFRHTAATHCYRATKDIRALQALLGHSNLNTTQLYTHILEEDEKELVERNPVNALLSATRKDDYTC